MGLGEVLEFDKNKYTVQKLPNPLLLHWILNPGLAFNECILGQRIPKITLIDKTKDVPLLERTYVPCPSCKALNDGRLWGKVPLGNWFGLVCPACGEKIPCLRNLTSLLVIGITFPIWIWIKIFFERRLLERQKRLLSQVNISSLPTAKTVNWARMGLLFGGTMFLFTLAQEPRAHLTTQRLLFVAGIWILGGFGFGFSMKFMLSRMNRRPK